MNLTIHKWVQNANGVTNPTQYTKFVKYKGKNRNPTIIGNSDFSRFRVFFAILRKSESDPMVDTHILV